jgi:hypothetical protein
MLKTATTGTPIAKNDCNNLQQNGFIDFQLTAIREIHLKPYSSSDKYFDDSTKEDELEFHLEL